MKRHEMLSKYLYQIPSNKVKRMIVHTDAKNEADDQYAIAHHLLTPYFDVRGIIGAHFEGKYEFDFAKNEQHLRGTSARQSTEEILKVLELMDIDDVPVCLGAEQALDQSIDFVTEYLDEHGNLLKEKREEVLKYLPESAGADMIISEAMREDEHPLFVACQGGITDIAVAYLKEPAIASRMTMIWIGGGMYPQGNLEFNLFQDVRAAQILFACPMAIWQVPQDAYSQMTTTLAELKYKVRPQGAIGNYLFEQMVEFNNYMAEGWPHGETWGLGDMATITVLLNEGWENSEYVIQKAPYINTDETYSKNPNGKDLRVYRRIDCRVTVEDFFAKLALCYGK